MSEFTKTALYCVLLGFGGAVAFLLLAGVLKTEPLTTSVSKDQNFTTPNPMRVNVYVAPKEFVATYCGKVAIEPHGCSEWRDGACDVYVDETFHDVAYAMEHEIQHCVWGPEHE